MFCFILGFLSDTEIPSLLHLSKQQKDWKVWDIISTKGQRHFYSKARAWGFLALFNTYLTNMPQGKTLLLTFNHLLPQGFPGIHLFLGRVIRPLEALCCHDYTDTGTCPSQFKESSSISTRCCTIAISRLSLELITTEVKIRFSIPDNIETGKTFMLSVSFLTSEIGGIFVYVILKNEHFKTKMKRWDTTLSSSLYALTLNIVGI